MSMQIDGVEADNRTVDLGPGAVENVLFAVVRDLPGNYQVRVDPLTVSFQVAELETYTSENFPFIAKYPAEWTRELVGGDPDHVLASGEAAFAQFLATPDDPNKSVE
ncbi:MAG: hypothetical protein IH884_00210, partial [Myxococcales bacterium]|nr:hypothetical protein [Myxococcales bacterium]